MTDRAGDATVAGGIVVAVRAGALAFIAILAVAEALALLVWAFGGTGLGIVDALGLGWLELGAVHHVEIRLEIRDLVTPAASRIDLGVGITLLTVTVAAAALLVRGGRAASDRAGGGVGRRIGVGASVTLGYGLPLALVSPFIDVQTTRPSETALTGVFLARLDPVQAAAFPLLLSLLAGAVGGVWSTWAARGRRPSSEPFRRAFLGGARMLLVGFALSFAGLFVGGVVDPDGPIALTTPTTARYVRTIVDRPAVGALLLGHHLAIAPAEAAWVVVPAMGGCVSARGSADADLLCYGAVPERIASPSRGDDTAELRLPGASVAFGAAPLPYLLFLLVPAGATVAGGASASRGTANRRDAVVAGALAGVVFAVGLAIVAVASTVSVGYASTIGGDTSAAAYVVGPDPIEALALGLAWGTGGGVAGALVARRLRTPRAGRPPRPAGR